MILSTVFYQIRSGSEKILIRGYGVFLPYNSLVYREHNITLEVGRKSLSIWQLEASIVKKNGTINDWIRGSNCSQQQKFLDESNLNVSIHHYTSLISVLFLTR